MLRKYMSDRGKIRSRRVTGNCAQHQRALAQAIKTARELVLLPYTQRTVTERPGGRGRDRGERSLSDSPPPRPRDVEVSTQDVDGSGEDVESSADDVEEAVEAVLAESEDS